jgi:hypothetical protein
MPIMVKVVTDKEYDDWKKCVQGGGSDCIDVPKAKGKKTS